MNWKKLGLGAFALLLSIAGAWVTHCEIKGEPILGRENCEDVSNKIVKRLAEESGCNQLISQEIIPPQEGKFNSLRLILACGKDMQAIYLISEEEISFLAEKPDDIYEVGKCTTKEDADYTIFQQSLEYLTTKG